MIEPTLIIINNILLHYKSTCWCYRWKQKPFFLRARVFFTQLSCAHLFSLHNFPARTCFLYTTLRTHLYFTNVFFFLEKLDVSKISVTYDN